jgi:hypothetical protein
MSSIKCLENYNLLKELLLKGERGSACFFAARLSVSTRTFFRYKWYMEKVEGLIIRYNKAIDEYYLE